MSNQRVIPLVALLLLLVVACNAQPVAARDPIGHDETIAFFSSGARIVAIGIEILGILVIIKGAVAAAISFVRDAMARFVVHEACRSCRHELGLAILLGLEFLVAADIIRTVTIQRTFQNVGILAAIVGVRTFLSFALEIEIEGRLPWKSAGS